LSDPAEVKTLPVWPADGKPSPAAGQFVFRDSATGEIVVSYPALDNANRRVTFRFWLQNRVEPQVFIQLSRNAESLYVYRYELANGASAKTPTWAWDVVGPGNDPNIAITHPVWDGTNFQDPVAPQALLKTAKQAAFLSWAGVSTPIAPGSKVPDFQIISGYKPGFTTAYATGNGGINAPDELTEQVAEQLLPLQRVSGNEKAVSDHRPTIRSTGFLSRHRSHLSGGYPRLVRTGTSGQGIPVPTRGSRRSAAPAALVV